MRANRIVVVSLRSALAALPLLPLSPVDAGAQGVEASLGGKAPPQAERLFQEGLEAWHTSQFEAAARKFDAALKLWPSSAKLAKMSGRAWEKANGAAAAISAYQLYLELAPFPEDQEEIDAAIARLQPLVDAQRAVVSVASRPPGARVFLDARKDQPLGLTPIEVKLDPGSYVLLTTLKGREPDRRTIIVQSGMPVRLDIELTLPGADADGERGLDWRMPAGFSLIGLGAAGLAAGVYFGIQAQDTQARIDDLPAGERDDYDRLKSDFDGEHTGAIVGFAAGGVSLAAGAGLIVWRILAPQTAPEPAAPPPAAAGAGTGMLWRF